MYSMKSLLRLLPNLYVIHLVRDPRAVTLSRQEFDDSGRGQFTIRHHVKAAPSRAVAEAMLYCGQVVRDLVVTRTLGGAISKRVASVRYDQITWI